MGGFRDAGLQRPINRRLGEVLGGLGVSTGGNTAGTTGTVLGPVVLAGLGGITLSQSVLGNRATISMSVASETGIGIAAGTQTATAGVVVLSNSNGITFGMSGSTRITAQHDGVRTVSAPNGSFAVPANLLQFANQGGPGGMQFATGGGSVIQGSASILAVAAGTQTANTATAIFSNANGITFGMSGSATVTASHGAATGAIINGQTGAAAISFNNQQMSFGTQGGIAFTNTAVAGTQVIIAGPVSVSYLENNGRDRGVFIGDVSQGTIHVAPFYAYAPISATRCDQIMNVTNSASAAATLTFRVGLYTMSGSTASRVSSTSRAWSYNSTMASSSYTQVSGTRYRSMALGTWNITPGNYLMAVQFSVDTALTSGTHQPFGGRDVSIVANEFPLGLGTAPAYFNGGFYSVTSAALPASFHLTDLQSTGANDVIFVPFVTFAGTF